MEYLQYAVLKLPTKTPSFCFKPCYKWNTFNTKYAPRIVVGDNEVLNLVITGIPSIQEEWLNERERY